MANPRSVDLLQVFILRIGKFYCTILIFRRNAVFFVSTMLTGTGATFLALKALCFAMMFTTASFAHAFYHGNIYRDTYNK